VGGGGTIAGVVGIAKGAAAMMKVESARIRPVRVGKFDLGIERPYSGSVSTVATVETAFLGVSAGVCMLAKPRF
jgi:hypothetical protein